MKAMILAAGNGKRLSSVTNGHNKCMLRLFGQPLVRYSLENAVRAGATEIVMVVGYQADEIKEYVGRCFADIDVRYALQPAPRGLVNAMECGRSAIGDSDFMLFLGDEYLTNPQHHCMIETFCLENLFGVCGVVLEPDKREIRKTYAIIEDAQGNIERLIEKPENPPNQMRGTGNCVFRAGLLQYIEATPVNPVRGEKELPDLIQCAINAGNLIKSYPIGDEYLNVNSPEDIQQVEQKYRTRVESLSSPAMI